MIWGDAQVGQAMGDGEEGGGATYRVAMFDRRYDIV